MNLSHLSFGIAVFTLRWLYVLAAATDTAWGDLLPGARYIWASDRADTFDATVALAKRADLTFAQFVLLTPFPATLDFERWAGRPEQRDNQIDGIPVTTHWLIPGARHAAEGAC